LALAAIVSANRGKRQFADPDRLDISCAPNRNLSFGLGPMLPCVARARLEGQVVITLLLRRVPVLGLAVAPVGFSRAVLENRWLVEAFQQQTRQGRPEGSPGEIRQGRGDLCMVGFCSL
jgi:cytochrome P450